MESANPAVVSMVSHKINAQARIELDGVCRSLSMLSWDLQVQQVLVFAGLPVSENLLLESVPLSGSSNATQLGHATLKDLVTASRENHGLALDWDDFQNKVTALVNRQKYAIQERDFSEINALVDDASTILGRKPVDVAEFHSAKQKALEDQVASIQRESQMRTAALQEKNTDLVRSLTDTKSEVAKLHDQNKSLMQESADRIASMTREMAVNQEIFERKAQDTIKQEALRLKAEHEAILAQSESEFNGKVAQAEALRLEADRRYADIQNRIERGDLVSASQIEEVNALLEQARNSETQLRNQLLEMNGALTDAHKKVQILTDEKSEANTRIETLNIHIGQLENRLSDIMEEKMGSSEFAVMQERLSMARNEIATLESQVQDMTRTSATQSRQFSELRGRFQEMRQVGGDHLKALHSQLKDNQERLVAVTSSYTQMRAALIIMTSLAMVASGAFMAVSTGLAG